MVFCPTALIRVQNTVLKDRIWTNRVTSEFVFPPFLSDTFAPCEGWRSCFEFSCKMSQMDCGHLGHFLFSWCQRVFRMQAVCLKLGLQSAAFMKERFLLRVAFRCPLRVSLQFEKNLGGMLSPFVVVSKSFEK